MGEERRNRGKERERERRREREEKEKEGRQREREEKVREGRAERGGEREGGEREGEAVCHQIWNVPVPLGFLSPKALCSNPAIHIVFCPYNMEGFAKASPFLSRASEKGPAPREPQYPRRSHSSHNRPERQTDLPLTREAARSIASLSQS